MRLERFPRIWNTGTMENWKVGRLEGWFLIGYQLFLILSSIQILPLTQILHYPRTHYSITLLFPPGRRPCQLGLPATLSLARRAGTKPRNNHPAFSGKRKPKRPMVLFPIPHVVSLFCFYSQMNPSKRDIDFCLSSGKAKKS